MRNRPGFSIALAVALVLLLGLEASARPGGGSSFRGSSSSSSRSSSSSSSSRSSSSSSRSSSSSSSSRSSSSSTSSRSGTSYGTTYDSLPLPPETYQRATRGDEGAVDATSAPSGSVFPPRPEHPPVSKGPDHISLGERILGFLFGAGFLVFVIGIVVGVFAFIGFLMKRARTAQGLDASWSTAAAPSVTSDSASSPGAVRRQLETITAIDPAFSVPILEDFLATLYVEVHTGRGTPTLANFTPYLRPDALGALSALGNARVGPVIVGAMRPIAFEANDALRLHRLTVELESNLTETLPGGTAQAFYALERWTLSRVYGTRSRPPGKARALTCPSCGAPLDKTTRGTCGYCRQAVDSGQFDWVVERVAVVEREARPPMLTGTTEEQGTTSPTIVDPMLHERIEQARVAGYSIDHVDERTHAIFDAMQRAWSSLAWDGARPYLSDRLWSAQTFWIAAYRNQGLRNVTENARIEGIERCRLSRDAYYVSITVRIRAVSLDYTLRDADGAVVGGSRTKPRPYTEYWTLIRSAAQPGPHGMECPACGAPLGDAMVTRCGHCGALVEASTFDWVLSRIDQDEVYAG
jgi:hypothetical protein